GLQARWRGRGQEALLRRGVRQQCFDLMRERSASGVSDRPDADPVRPRMLDLLAGRIEQRALLRGVAIKVGKLLAILAGEDDGLGAGGRARLETTKARLHIREP